MSFLESLMALTLFGSFIWFAIIGAIVFILFFVSEVNENGFLATAALIVFCILFYFWGSEPYEKVIQIFTWRNVGIYFGAGLIYSFIRAFFYARRETREYIESNSYTYVEREKEKQGHELDINLKGHVFRWWFLWPISLLTLVFTDVVREVYDFLYSILKRVYDAILEIGIRSVSKKVSLRKK